MIMSIMNSQDIPNSKYKMRVHAGQRIMTRGKMIRLERRVDGLNV